MKFIKTWMLMLGRVHVVWCKSEELILLSILVVVVMDYVMRMKVLYGLS